MPSVRGPIPAATAMQTAVTAVGNGTSINATGAARAVIEITRAAALTAGQIIIERLVGDPNEPTNWKTCTGVTAVDGADDAADNATIDFGEIPITLKVSDFSGPTLLRARVSTLFTGAGATVTVRGLVIR